MRSTHKCVRIFSQTSTPGSPTSVSVGDETECAALCAGSEDCFTWMIDASNNCSTYIDGVSEATESVVAAGLTTVCV